MRAYPATHHTPKTLLSVAGKPLIVRNIEILRDRLGVRDITLVIGHLGPQIRAELAGGERFGIKLDYVECPDPGVGLAMGLLPVVEKQSEPFVVMLGDELYLESGHEVFGKVELGNALAACAVLDHEWFALL